MPRKGEIGPYNPKYGRTLAGELLHALRQRHGVTLEQLEAESGVKQEILSEIETGKTREPTYRTAEAIARAFREKHGVPIDGTFFYHGTVQAIDIMLANNIQQGTLTDTSGQQIPVLGTVPTNQPLVSVESATEFVVMTTQELAGVRIEDTFFVRAGDDSMAGEGIKIGDLVQVVKTSTFERAGVYLIRLRDELLLRWVEIVTDGVYHIRSSSGHADVIVGDEGELIARAVEVRHKL